MECALGNYGYDWEKDEEKERKVIFAEFGAGASALVEDTPYLRPINVLPSQKERAFSHIRRRLREEGVETQEAASCCLLDVIEAVRQIRPDLLL